MRVTGGIARGRRLKSPPAKVRPTSDLVRSAIFDVLEAQEADLSRVLDLYAGSGALGIEALSRGGDWCDFVEQDATLIGLIRENLALTGLQDCGRAHRLKVERVPERLGEPYTLVLADPPYEDDTALPSLERVAQSRLVAPRTALVLEHSRRREPPAALGSLRLAWSRRYGDTRVSIYRQEPEEGAA